MPSCERTCRNRLIVVPAFFMIFGGLILLFVGAAFSPKATSDGMTFTREARTSISKPCIVIGVILTVLGILHCVTMAVLIPLAKQSLQRFSSNKLLKQESTQGEDVDAPVGVEGSEKTQAPDDDGYGDETVLAPLRRHGSRLQVLDIDVRLGGGGGGGGKEADAMRESTGAASSGLQKDSALTKLMRLRRQSMTLEPVQQGAIS